MKTRCSPRSTPDRLGFHRVLFFRPSENFKTPRPGLATWKDSVLGRSNPGLPIYYFLHIRCMSGLRLDNLWNQPGFGIENYLVFYPLQICAHDDVQASRVCINGDALAHSAASEQLPPAFVSRWDPMQCLASTLRLPPTCEFALSGDASPSRCGAPGLCGLSACPTRFRGASRAEMATFSPLCQAALVEGASHLVLSISSALVAARMGLGAADNLP